ncbi:peptide chain release factor N(5)-glutamine methyltransferase [Halobacillus massiliensis]|uniref:peptide chain release factor N(5)-glutamine methyltransferase n=1 Tax=Halobacillus massiliensis TaxID=1926286 RepID=UPI0009E262EA|nr:peptide chain release factor N(5)-glutamine methyltransferase [Halobacillus massiliensis]
MNFTTIEEARRWASIFLTKYEREPRVADYLLEDLLNLSYSMMLAYGRDPFPENLKGIFVKKVKEHAETGRPVQHMLGYAHFYGREFTVNPSVLIPRPETEELVEGVLKRLKPVDNTIADIGTGSGIIAVTLKLETDRRVLASDISAEALETAQANADKMKAEIEWREGDFLKPLKDDRVDVLVSNPPYIDRSDQLQDTVEHFDPHLALFADENGLAAYKSILKQVKEREQQPRLIAFEIGHLQGEPVSELIYTILGNYQVEVLQDINGRDRMIFAIQVS